MFSMSVNFSFCESLNQYEAKAMLYWPRAESMPMTIDDTLMLSMVTGECGKRLGCREGLVIGKHSESVLYKILQTDNRASCR